MPSSGKEASRTGPQDPRASLHKSKYNIFSNISGKVQLFFDYSSTKEKRRSSLRFQFYVMSKIETSEANAMIYWDKKPDSNQCTIRLFKVQVQTKA